MASNRGAKYTQLKKIIVAYATFLNNFDRHPITNTLAIAKNQDSVKQSIRNLILTNIGERLYQPNVGSNVRKSLFEFGDVQTATNIRFFVINTITTYEKRANLLEVSVGYSIDGQTFTVNVIFSMNNIPDPINMQMLLQRPR